MKVLIDTNIVLDVLLDREPFAVLASRLFELVESGHLEGVVGATTITTIDYFLRKSLPSKVAVDTLKKILKLFEIAPVNRLVLEDALESGFTDFEDSVLHAAALHVGAQAIITRDDKGFRRAKLAIYTPERFLNGFKLDD